MPNRLRVRLRMTILGTLEKLKPSNIKGSRCCCGGAGGNRTPVRKPSAGSSTYLAMLFMFNFYFTNKQANVKASYLKFKKLLSSPIISESLFMTL